MSSEGTPILRVVRVLEERGISLEPLLSLVTAVGTENVFLGVGTLSGRVLLLVPSRADVLAIVGVEAALPQRSMLLVSAQRDEPLSAAVVIGGPTSAADAVDEVGPPGARALWLPLVQVPSGGSIRNRTRYLGAQQGTITVSFPARNSEAEGTFVAELATLAARLGAPDSWRRVYDEAGPGADIGITTTCTEKGPSARLAMRFGNASWDRAIDLAKALVDSDRARGAAVHMGMLAGGLEVDTLRGVETVHDAATPDLIVWLALSTLESVKSADESVQLRRQIARCPDDLALREKWAELVERRGDAARACLIREQLARRARQTLSPDYAQFVSAVEAELLALHPDWCAELAPLGVSRAVLSGGCLEAIEIDAATLLANAPAIFDQTPVRRIRLTGDVRLLPQLVDEGAFERVVWLDLDRLRVDAELIASLVPASALRALGLGRAGVTDALVEQLWVSFPRLIVCDIEHNPCTELVTRELTYQEMSGYEWVKTERAIALEERYGARAWVYPSSYPGSDPLDLEQVLAQIANAR